MFKVGDKVRRIVGDNFPQYNMYRGQIYTVEECTPYNLFLRETILANAGFSPDCFELVKREKTGFGRFIERVENVQDR